MAALIITPELEADAQRLAERLGKTPTDAVCAVLREKLGATEPLPPKNFKKIDEILARLHAGPVDYSATEDEILGYDEDGIPEQPYLDR